MISERYTLFTRIPLFVAPDGEVYADELWRRDLQEHLVYIRDFRICCPTLLSGAAPENARPVQGLSSGQITPLRMDRGWGSVVRNVLPNFAAVYRAARRSEVVHSGGAGWAFPLSYYLLILKPVLRFKWLIVIESSFWMKPTRRRATAREYASHALNSFLLRRCLRASDAQIYTQAWYRDFFGGCEETSLIAPAVWVNESDLLGDAARERLLAERDPDVVRLIFPARLVRDKGVDVVLAAIPRVEMKLGPDCARGVRIDLMGEGELAEECRSFATGYRGAIEVRYLESVQYGEPFLAALRRYDAVVVANYQAEQPRIVFDAFSQGVPCIATRTSGISSVVEEGRTALLFDIGDAEDLAERIVKAVRDPGSLRSMGAEALRYARGWTHRGMHQTREAFLERSLALASG